MSDYQTINLVLESSSLKVCGIIFSIVCKMVLIPAFYSVIWYEKFASNTNRTVLNRLVSSVCMASILWLVFPQTIDIIKFIYGPLPVYLCHLTTIFRNGLVMYMILIFMSMSLLKYLFIFGGRNPGINFIMKFQHKYWC